MDADGHRWEGKGKLKPRIDTNEHEFEKTGKDAKWAGEWKNNAEG
jgi:hypothetical protein